MREIKFEYGFTNHAPIRFTLNEIQSGKVMDLITLDVGSIKYRRQYTGLKDKSGREIYEGDVLEFDNEDGIWCCPVVFERGLFGLDVHNVKQVKNPGTWDRGYDRVRSRWWSITWGYEEMGTAFTFRKPLAQDTIFKGDYKEYRDSEERKKQEEIGWGKYFMRSAKVIGNIYENPELNK